MPRPVPPSWRPPHVRFQAAALPPLPPLPGVYKAAIVASSDHDKPQTRLLPINVDLFKSGSTGQDGSPRYPNPLSIDTIKSLAYLGDSVLKALAFNSIKRVAISESRRTSHTLPPTFPLSFLLSNNTLSHVSLAYDLSPDMIKVPARSRNPGLMQQKFQATLLEAYIGAVYQQILLQDGRTLAVSQAGSGAGLANGRSRNIQDADRLDARQSDVNAISESSQAEEAESARRALRAWSDQTFNLAVFPDLWEDLGEIYSGLKKRTPSSASTDANKSSAVSTKADIVDATKNEKAAQKQKPQQEETTTPPQPEVKTGAIMANNGKAVQEEAGRADLISASRSPVITTLAAQGAVIDKSPAKSSAAGAAMNTKETKKQTQSRKQGQEQKQKQKQKKSKPTSQQKLERLATIIEKKGAATMTRHDRKCAREKAFKAQKEHARAIKLERRRKRKEVASDAAAIAVALAESEGKVAAEHTPSRKKTTRGTGVNEETEQLTQSPSPLSMVPSSISCT